MASLARIHAGQGGSNRCCSTISSAARSRSPGGAALTLSSSGPRSVIRRATLGSERAPRLT